MALVCEDLDESGVVLIPECSGKAATLVNRAKVAIASLAYVWTFRRGVLRKHPPGGTSVLLPFGWNDQVRKIHAYSQTIFPGSKRLLTSDGNELGDNTDVRPPNEDEVWHGGFVGLGGGSAGTHGDRGEALKLTLDGVFFVDGGFAGPNQLGSWEDTVYDAEAHLAYAALARAARDEGTPANVLLDRVRELSGFTDDRHGAPRRRRMYEAPEEARRIANQKVGWVVSRMRLHVSDEQVVAKVVAWGEAAVPHFSRHTSAL